MNTRSLLRPSRFAPTRLLPLLIAVLCAPLACKPEKDPRKDFREATALFSRLERRSPERCYLDPRMGQVEELLKGVPPESPDYTAAQGLLRRIQVSRDQLNAQKTSAADIRQAPEGPIGKADAGAPAAAGTGATPSAPAQASASKSPNGTTAKKDGGSEDEVPLEGLTEDQVDPRIEKAKALFERFARMENDYDLYLVELYADGAKLSVTGKELPMKRFRALMVKTLGQARKKKAKVEYANVNYEPEGERVRITATRNSSLDGKGPASMLVGPGRSSDWVIYQHSFEQHPTSGRRR